MQAVWFQDTSSNPHRRRPGGPARYGRPQHEPVFKAPWPALLIAALILGGYGLQTRIAPEALEPWVFSPAALEDGRWPTLLSAVFLHGGWLHALVNAAMALAFATPLARFFGERSAGVVAFFLFYLTCGALGNLGYAAVHPGSAAGLVGASGAVAGLMGAAARLLAGGGRLGRLSSPTVIGMTAALLIVNLLVAVLGGGWVPGAGGAGVAWEAHLAGYLAGLLLVGPFARLAQPR